MRPDSSVKLVTPGVYGPIKYGFKAVKYSYRGARGQPRTRGPAADETKTMTVTLPHHACVRQSKRRQHRPVRARPVCGCPQRALLPPRHSAATWRCKSENSSADALFTQGLMTVDAADHLLREGAVCTRVCDRVLSTQAVPRRTEAVWLRARALTLVTQAHPSQPHSRLIIPVHVGGRLADSG